MVSPIGKQLEEAPELHLKPQSSDDTEMWRVSAEAKAALANSQSDSEDEAMATCMDMEQQHVYKSAVQQQTSSG